MDSDDDLPTGLASAISRCQFLEARLARCQRELAEAHKTIRMLTQLAASKPGLTEVGVIAQAALLGTIDGDDVSPRNDAAAVTAR